MIPLVNIKGTVKKKEETTVGEDKTPFNVYFLQLDCYIPELDLAADYHQGKNQDGNLQHYVTTRDDAQNFLLANLKLETPHVFQLAVLPKSSNGKPKLKLRFLSARELSPKS